MRKMWVVLAVISAVPAFAQQVEAKKVVKPAKVQEVTFEGDDIIGGREQGLGTLINPRPPAVFPNLIRIRGDFNDKLMQSVNEL